jgi:ABC-type nitrate/sulfonate/bicarbonate transport system permease component
MMAGIKKKLAAWRPAGFWLLALLAWELAARTRLITSLFFPAPSTIFLTLARMVVSGELLVHLGYTLYRLTLGLVTGGSLGWLLGLWMGWSPRSRALFGPLIAALHPLPKLALLPLALIIFGLGERSKIVLVALTAFFPLLINTMTGVQQIDDLTWEVARHYHARGWTLVRRVILPGSLPMALAGLQLALNTALMVTVAVELVASQTGLGAVIWMAWQTLRLPEMYATLLVIASLGLGASRLFAALARCLAPWQSEELFPPDGSQAPEQREGKVV